MKKIIISIVFIFVAVISYAQWNFSGNNIYNTNSGYVGIGSGSAFTPTDQLHIKTTNVSGVMLETNASSGPTGYYRIKNTTSGAILNMVLRTTSGVTEMVQSVYDPFTPKWCEFAYFNVATHKYEMHNGVTDAEYMNVGKVLFNNAGGVGIGVSTIPSGVQFAVNGKINCKEVEVTLTGWSDNVFKSDYNLMPLQEVENFIAANNHLPGVPAEKEVLKKGVNLGDMDAVLLKKIEELTLYMIELKKENEQLRKKIEEIK